MATDLRQLERRTLNPGSPDKSTVVAGNYLDSFYPLQR